MTASAPLPGWGNISILSLGHFVSDFFTNLLPVLLPLFALQFQISYSQCALIFAVFSVSCNILQPAIGLWADRGPLTRILPYTIALSALLICTVGWFAQYWLLIAVLVLCGLCSSFFHPLSAGLLPSLLPPRAKGLATSIYIAGGNLGAALAPLILAAFLEHFSTRGMLVFVVPAALTCALMLLRRLDRRRTAPQRGDEISLKGLIKSRDYLLLNLSVCLRSWAYCGFMTFTPLLYQSLGCSALEGAAALVCLMTGAVAGGLIAGALSDKFSLRTVLIGSYILIGLSTALFALDPDFSFLSLTLLFIGGAAMYAAVPVGVVWGQRLLPSHAAFTASMMLGFSFAVGFALVPLTGLLADRIGLTAAVPGMALPLALAAIITLLPVHEPDGAALAKARGR